jgi:hypothetical protein
VAQTAGNGKPRIAVFSGPTATIQNSEPLVTSNKAREKYGLPPRRNPDDTRMRFDVLRAQRLAAPVTVYIEQFSAHPLERKRHTHTSAVNLSRLPSEVQGSRVQGSQVAMITVPVKDAKGNLLPAAIPKVTIMKHARYLPEDTSGNESSELDILARIEKNLRDAPLGGFVAEGSAPFGAMSNSVDAALKRATHRGMPVVKVGRGNAGGFVDAKRDPLAIAGNNLTATKARLLLMACLMKFGSLPTAVEPMRPTAAETEAIKAKLSQYQEVFDTH